MREAFEFVFLEGDTTAKKRLTLFMINAHFLCFYFIFYDLVQIQTDTNGWRGYFVSLQCCKTAQLSENQFKELPLQPHVSICGQSYTHL